MLSLFRKLFFGSSSADHIRRFQKIVAQVNALEANFEPLSNDQLRQKTNEFKDRLAKGETLDALLPEAFAVVREASKRTLKMRHFDVQIMGGIALHQGAITEMKTGEGKTLVATLAAYLNALSGKGVFVVTVNDYLAKRDSEWMGQIYTFLGLSVGLIQANMPIEDRQNAYRQDIIYGTNNEFGFDYLRDNMATDLRQCVQRNLHFAIIDEVDSILIDEARTPLIISGVVEENVEKYRTLARLAKKFKPEEHFTFEEKTKNVTLTEEGITYAEKMLNVEYLYDIENMDRAHMLVQCLKAIHLFKNEVDYIVKDNEVIIVDEFTGRLMNGRRYSDGLHQAIEAVENLTIQQESQTLASITFQNYFRMFEKLSGMTGTAMTEASEFQKIYGVESIEIPTNKPIVRKDMTDAVYKSRMGKYRAVVNEIIKTHKEGRPVLVGTIAIETSELLSKMLQKRNIPHHVLNAKYHEKEAEIIANAGQPGAVTIATNMAGRGTDIVLGEGVAEKGGLAVLGTERHESRRIDNQLRGRCGRQGDPGLTKFYVSLEDDLMRLFGSDKIIRLMESLGFDEETPIEHSMITKSIERAQKKVEQYHFNIRKQLLEYDDVMNKQREIIYKQRRLILEQERILEKVEEIIQFQIKVIVSSLAPESLKLKDIDLDAIRHECETLLPTQFIRQEFSSREELLNYFTTESLSFFRNYIKMFQLMDFKAILRIMYLHALDTRWIEHLKNMDMLRDGIGLRAYAQKDPLLEYKREGYDMFQDMMDAIEREVIQNVFRVQIVTGEEAQRMEEQQENVRITSYKGGGTPALTGGPDNKKVGRNDPCPCGSGKKYKQCCGKYQ